MRKDGATGATATLPGGTGTGGTDIRVVAELLGGQRVAQRGLEVDGINLRAGIVDQGWARLADVALAWLLSPGDDPGRGVVDSLGGVVPSARWEWYVVAVAGQLVSIVVFVLCQVAG